MKKILAGILLIVMLAVFGYTNPDIGFYFEPQKKVDVFFGIGFDLARFKGGSLGLDLAPIKFREDTRILVGFSFKISITRSLILSVGTDFNNKRFYIGFGVR